MEKKGYKKDGHDTARQYPTQIQTHRFCNDPSNVIIKHFSFQILVIRNQVDRYSFAGKMKMPNFRTTSDEQKCNLLEYCS